MQASAASVVLRERKVMKVEVLDLSPGAAVVRLDRIGSLSGLHDGIWKRSCDYMIVSPSGDGVHVLFVELKRTLTDETAYLEQLRRSLPLLKYLLWICRIECRSDPGRLEVRYAVIAARGSPRLDKQPVRRPGSPQIKKYKDIEVSLHIVGQRIGFDRLWRR